MALSLRTQAHVFSGTTASVSRSRAQAAQAAEAEDTAQQRRGAREFKYAPWSAERTQNNAGFGFSSGGTGPSLSTENFPGSRFSLNAWAGPVFLKTEKKVKRYNQTQYASAKSFLLNTKRKVQLSLSRIPLPRDSLSARHRRGRGACPES